MGKYVFRVMNLLKSQGIIKTAENLVDATQNADVLAQLAHVLKFAQSAYVRSQMI